MGAGTAWIITGGVLMCAGAALFVITHVKITKWLRAFEKEHE